MAFVTELNRHTNKRSTTTKNTDAYSMASQHNIRHFRSNTACSMGRFACYSRHTTFLAFQAVQLFASTFEGLVPQG